MRPIGPFTTPRRPGAIASFAIDGPCRNRCRRPSDPAIHAEHAAGCHGQCSWPRPCMAGPTPMTRNGNGTRRRARILVVDDDPSFHEALSSLLAGEGYEVVAAHGGVQ